MTPRPIIGEIYDRGGHELTVQAVDDLHVVCTCPECEPGVKPCDASEGRGHIFTRKQFADHLGGSGPFTS